MRGNGRWAARRGLPRAAGHRAGADAVRRIVEAAPDQGVAALTLFAFSADNWKRPASEVAALMRLFARHLHTETPRLLENGVRLDVVGRRDRLPAPLVTAIRDAERATARGTRLRLRLAVDYSARAAIADRRILPDVDLLIRTGGEQRLSDFLLWECAYAELYFTEIMWPDFAAADLADALRAFHARQRRVRRAAGSAARPRRLGVRAECSRRRLERVVRRLAAHGPRRAVERAADRWRPPTRARRDRRRAARLPAADRVRRPVRRRRPGIPQRGRDRPARRLQRRRVTRGAHRNLDGPHRRLLLGRADPKGAASRR